MPFVAARHSYSVLVDVKFPKYNCRATRNIFAMLFSSFIQDNAHTFRPEHALWIPQDEDPKEYLYELQFSIFRNETVDLDDVLSYGTQLPNDFLKAIRDLKIEFEVITVNGV